MVSTYMKAFLHPALLYTIFVHIVVPGKLTCIKFASLLGSSRQNHENCSIEDCAVLSTTYWCCIYQANNDSQDGFSNCTVRLAVQMTPWLEVTEYHNRSLERDKHSEQERIQALKLIRMIMEVDCSQMSACIVQALVSCAENQEDSLCRVCLEAICEIGMLRVECQCFYLHWDWSHQSLGIRNPRITAHCNGIRLIFDSILDPFYSGMQECLIVAVLYLLNDPSTRVYVRHKYDIQVGTLHSFPPRAYSITDNFSPFNKYILYWATPKKLH